MEDERRPGGSGEPDDPMLSDEAGETLSLTAVGAKTVELYQKQGEICDRVWSYMSLYSGILFALSLALLLLGDRLAKPDWWYWIFPAVAYLAFAIGNYKTLCNSLAELRMMRGIARAHSRLDLTGFEAATAERFHLLMMTFVLVFFVIAVTQIYR